MKEKKNSKKKERVTLDKPRYRYGVWDKAKKKLVENPWVKNKPLMFEYPKQVQCYIEKYLGGSPNFEIWDKEKAKK